MSNYVLVAVGGSGARVAQSVVAMVAAGMLNELQTLHKLKTSGDAADELVVKLVDLDVKHADGKELKDMIDAYNAAVGFLSEPGGQVWNTRGWKMTKIRLESDADFAFQTGLGNAIKKTETIEDLVSGIGQGNNPRLLLDALYGSDDRFMPLLQGCKARPRIGSLLWKNLYDQDPNGFWSGIQQLGKMPNIRARFMFTGSVFGGTGASGVPTLASELRKSLVSGMHSNDLKIGLTLMMPYFRLTCPATAPVQANVFPFESKMSMGYYVEPAVLQGIDCVQVVGDEPQAMQKYDEEQNKWFQLEYTDDDDPKPQNNPSLPAELVAAIGICEFFAGVPGKDAGCFVQDCKDPIDKPDGKSRIYSAQMLPESDATRKCLNRLERFVLLMEAFYNVQVNARKKPTVICDLWGRNDIQKIWESEEDGVGRINRLSNELSRWISELDHNGLKSVFEFDTTESDVRYCAQKGKTSFQIADAQGSRMAGCMNTNALQYLTELKRAGMTHANLRGQAFALALLDACDEQ